MDDKSFANYLHSLPVEEIFDELIKYKESIQEQTIATSYRKWIVFGKKRRDLATRRHVEGWAKTLDFINTKIAEGSL